MRLSLRHQLNIAFGVVVATVLLTAGVALRDARGLVGTADAISRSQELIGTADQVRSSLADMELAWHAGAERGEVEPWRSFARADTGARLGIERLARLASRDARLSDLTRRLAGTIVPADHDERSLDSARAIADEILVLAHSEILALSAVSRASARHAALAASIALAVAVVLVLLAFVAVRGELAVRLRAERALAQSEARFRAAVDGGFDAFYILRAVRADDGAVADFEFVELNARAEALLGLTRAEVLGQHLCELLPRNRESGFFDSYVSVMRTGRAVEEELELPDGASSSAWIRQIVVPLEDGVAIASRDVTERRRTEEALRTLSLVDDLTGLYNRRGFLTLAQQQLKLARRSHRELLLLFIDMDDFKAINDTFGHSDGDLALTRAAAILRKTFRDSDILARMGGDEFVVLAADSPRTARDSVIARLRAELRERNERDGFPYALSFSIGVAHFDPMRPPSIEALLATADAMLYEQKRRRRGELEPERDLAIAASVTS